MRTEIIQTNSKGYAPLTISIALAVAGMIIFFFYGKHNLTSSVGFVSVLLSNGIFIKYYRKQFLQKEDVLKENNLVAEENPVETKEVITTKEEETYYLEIDPKENPKELILKGNYDWQNDDINDKFSFNKEYRVTAKIFDYEGNTDEAIQTMRSEGFQPATAFELLAFGATYPEVQRKFPIMALGTVYTSYMDNSRCLCSYNCSSKREPGQRGLGFHFYVFGPKEKNCHLLGIKRL